MHAGKDVLQRNCDIVQGTAGSTKILQKLAQRLAPKIRAYGTTFSTHESIPLCTWSNLCGPSIRCYSIHTLPFHVRKRATEIVVPRLHRISRTATATSAAARRTVHPATTRHTTDLAAEQGLLSSASYELTHSVPQSQPLDLSHGPRVSQLRGPFEHVQRQRWVRP